MLNFFCKFYVLRLSSGLQTEAHIKILFGNFLVAIILDYENFLSLLEYYFSNFYGIWFSHVNRNWRLRFDISMVSISITSILVNPIIACNRTGRRRLKNMLNLSSLSKKNQAAYEVFEKFTAEAASSYH